MNTLDEKVSPLTYCLAVVAGMMCVLPTAILARFLSGLFYVGPRDFMFTLVPAAAACYGLAGAAFGFVRPERGWRWGVWLTALPACLASYFFADDVKIFLLIVGLTLIPACACAYVAARAHLNYTRVI